MTENKEFDETIVAENYTEDLDVAPFDEDLKTLMSIVPILVPILFSVIIVIGFIGNLLVVLVVLLNKNMKSTTNLLILNLAVRKNIF